MPSKRKSSTLLLLIDTVGVCLTLVLALCLYAFSLGPAIERKNGLQTELRDLLQRLSDQPRLVVAVSDAERMKADMLDWATAPQKTMPAELDFEDFYATLSDDADKNLVLIKYVKPEKVTSNKAWACREMRVSIRATASFENFHRFLYALTTQNDHLIRMQTLTVRPVQGSDLCNMDLLILLQARGEKKRQAARAGEFRHGA